VPCSGRYSAGAANLPAHPLSVRRLLVFSLTSFMNRRRIVSVEAVLVRIAVAYYCSAINSQRIGRVRPVSIPATGPPHRQGRYSLHLSMDHHRPRARQ
jgi:hypothetical protein